MKAERLSLGKESKNHLTYPRYVLPEREEGSDEEIGFVKAEKIGRLNRRIESAFFGRLCESMGAKTVAELQKGTRIRREHYAVRPVRRGLWVIVKKSRR